jgi:hypothetical protein
MRIVIWLNHRPHVQGLPSEGVLSFRHPPFKRKGWNAVRGLILDIQADNLNSEDRAGDRALRPRGLERTVDYAVVLSGDQP